MSKIKLGDRVETPYGMATVECQDSVMDPIGGGKTALVLLERWGVIHDVYPKGKPEGMYKKDILYFPANKLKLRVDSPDR